ncbi:hypothetical protein ACIP98_36370 [Streptomyces sp. NPDC088354]|uniref:hypothetical protein n=1 Tax=Streptomyces sp. NPDC088354 TaxID=3365856 RepID=UPI003815C974
MTTTSPAAGCVLLPVSVDDPAWQWRWSFEANGSAGGNARVHTRTQLTMGHWPGDIEHAAQIAARMMDNADRHSQPPPRARLGLRLAVLDTGELLIEVSDPMPAFPNFATAITWEPAIGEPPRGLWTVRKLGGRLSYAIADDGCAKTVQALVPGTPT